VNRYRALIVLTITTAFWPAARVAGQRAGSTTLLVNVVPEFQVTPTQLSVRFIVSGDGATDILTQTALVAARARALPNRQIHLTASLGDVTGPTGAAPSAIIEWIGLSLGATGGAQSATCTSGSLAAGSLQDLAAVWPSSGSITCRIAFTLANPRNLPPGSYSTVIAVALHAE
jgi:hypothetical protein